MKHNISTRLGGVLLSLTATMTAVATAAPSATALAHTVQIAGKSTTSPDKLRDPKTNRAATPDFHVLCATDGPRNTTCIQQALAAINSAHAAEGVRRMILPKNYSSLNLVQQTFVVTNLERVDRGMRPIIGLTATLNASAHHAALIRDDPTLIGAVLSLLGIREYASIWAGDFGPLASDYDWMYNDGYSPNGSVNIDCKTPNQEGCWGHRHAILGLFSGLPTLLAGGGSAGPAGGSLAEVIVGALGKVPALTYSWAQALAEGANGHQVTA